MLEWRQPGNLRGYNLLRPTRDRQAKRKPPTSRDVLSSTASDVSKLVTMDPSYKPIGRGGFGQVFLGVYRGRGAVALKRPFAEDCLKAIRSEIDIWMRLKHDHILDFIGTCFLENHLHLVLPYVRNGNLSDYIKTHRYMDRLRILTQTADAIAYLHSVGIIHGDIKANNILVGRSEEAYVSDFGLSKLIESQTVSSIKGAGSPRWQAPELFENAPKSFETDVYAFGITIAEVLKGETPFSDLTDSATILAVYVRGSRPEVAPLKSPAGVSYKPMWDVAKQCWCKAAAHRIAMLGAFTALQTARSKNEAEELALKSEKLQKQSLKTNASVQHKPSAPPTSPLAPPKPELVEHPQKSMKPSQPMTENKSSGPRPWSTVVGNLPNASRVVPKRMIGSAELPPLPASDRVPPKSPISTHETLGSGLGTEQADTQRSPSLIETKSISDNSTQSLAGPSDEIYDHYPTHAPSHGNNVDPLPMHRDDHPPWSAPSQTSKTLDLQDGGEPPQCLQPEEILKTPPGYLMGMTSTEITGVDVVADNPATVRQDEASPSASRKWKNNKVPNRRGDLGFHRPHRLPELLATSVSFVVASEIDDEELGPSRTQIEKPDLRSGTGFYRPPQLRQKHGALPVSFTVMSAVEGELPDISVETETLPHSSKVQQPPTRKPPSNSDSILEASSDIPLVKSSTVRVRPALPPSGTNVEYDIANDCSSRIMTSVLYTESDDVQQKPTDHLIPATYANHPTHRPQSQDAHNHLPTLLLLPPLQKSVTDNQNLLNPRAREFSPSPVNDPYNHPGPPYGFLSGTESIQTTPALSNFQSQPTPWIHNTPSSMGTMPPMLEQSPYTPHYPWTPSPYREYHGSSMPPPVSQPPTTNPATLEVATNVIDVKPTAGDHIAMSSSATFLYPPTLHAQYPPQGAVFPYGVSHPLIPNPYAGYHPPTWQAYGPMTPAGTVGTWATFENPLHGTPHIYSLPLYPQ